MIPSNAFLIRFMMAVAIMFAAIQVQVLAECECGYMLKDGMNKTLGIYTDAFESDFQTLKNITADSDWTVQQWNVSAKMSKGPYGRILQARNVISNPLVEDKNGNKTLGKNGNTAGLELWVRPGLIEDTYISGSEIDSIRRDMKYGTFRTGMQATPVNGTCAAFFWYLNDTQEIDMEFLSQQFESRTPKYPLHLVLHSTLSQRYGGDAKKTGNYKVVNLPFHPSTGFHEYRFDWSPEKVSFYVDGVWLHDMNDTRYVPSVAGKMVLSHWSNGQPLWSGGPPEEDAKIVVSYVKAYFNSTDPVRQYDHRLRCTGREGPEIYCPIPEQKGPPPTGDVYFFYKDGYKAINQSIYGKSVNAAMVSKPLSYTFWITVILLLGFYWL